MSTFKLKVRRYDPESGDAARWERFDVDLPPERSVLAAILKARDDKDGSLAIRCSCQAAICGSCGVRINGDAALACNTLLRDAAASPAAEGGVIAVEPLGNMTVLKDLVVDMDAVHWKKIQQIKPWLRPAEAPPEDGEYIVDAEAMVDVTQTMACIQCGVCMSDCLSLEVDPLFTGPAPLAKVYRFVGDPRDGTHKERLTELALDPHGMYDCTHCFKCVEVCPKDVAPMNQIMRLRRRAIHDHDITDPNNGRRHEEAFVKIIRRKGLLDESLLFQESHDKKDPRPLIKGMPAALRALRTGKATPRKLVPGLGHSIPGRRALRALFERAEASFRQLNLYIVGEEDLIGPESASGEEKPGASPSGAAPSAHSKEDGR